MEVDSRYVERLRTVQKLNFQPHGLGMVAMPNDCYTIDPRSPSAVAAAVEANDPQSLTALRHLTLGEQHGNR